MTLDYMGRKSHKSPFDMNRLPLEDELEAFEIADEDTGPCCTIDDFRPDLNGTARSKWNTSVAEVFVEAYMEEGSVATDDPALVKKYFVRHLKYLITKFKERNTEKDVLIARAKAKRRRERRAYVRGPYFRIATMLTHSPAALQSPSDRGEFRTRLAASRLHPAEARSRRDEL